MRRLAGFVMGGRSQAVMAVTVPAVLALLLPALGILSSAALALVTLRIGGREGLIVMALAVVTCALFSHLLVGSVGTTLGFFIVLWLPIWCLGLLLRWSRSLSLTVQVMLGFGVCLIATLHLGLDNSQRQLTQALQPLAVELVQSGLLEPKEGQTLVHTLQMWVPGILAAGLYLQLLLALCIARSWQAQLYNPGGFAAEFQAMRVHEAMAMVSLPLFMLVALYGVTAPALARDLTLLLIPLWLVQGLAIIHGIVSQANLHVGALIVLYAMLLLVTIPVVMLIVLIGLTDVIMDFRSRLRPKPGAD